MGRAGVRRVRPLGANVAFIANLMASSIDFVVVDMPSANKLTPHILAAVAEYEREMISTEPRPPRLPPRHAALG